VSAARAKGLQLTKPEDFESGSGIGVRGIVEGRRLALGNTALMEQVGVSVTALKEDESACVRRFQHHALRL
jgi:Cu+-exporting ATPase